MVDLRISPPFKKQRLAGVDETLDDRISQLPDSLLVDILSVLPTKDAFTTCVLSKRWQFLWTLVYNFTFTRYDLWTDGLENFGTFVDYVFANCTSPVINKLDIDCRDIEKYESRFNGWLHFAAQRNVEHVVLRSQEEVSNVKFHKFPESFLRCSSLSSLHIRDCMIDFDAVVEWKSLKSIKMEGVLFPYFDIPLSLLSGCPALEAMKLVDIDSMIKMNLASSQLKRLTVKGCHFYVVSPFYVLSPYVQHLEFSGDFDGCIVRLADVSSLVSAKLTCKNTCGYLQKEDEDEDERLFHDQYHSDLMEEFENTLQNLSDATELTELAIGTWFTQVICFLQLKKLGQIDHCRYELKKLAKGEKTDLESYTPSFEFPKLKNVKIVNSLGLCLKDYSKPGHDKVFKLSEFLLKRAAELEKFVIISNTRRCKRCSMNCASPYLFQLAQQLLGFPRSSNSVIIFQE